MKSRDFFIISIIVIAIVAGIVSYISVLYLVKPVLLAGQYGYVGVTGLSSGVTNVVVVDTLAATTGIDSVTFNSVTRGSRYWTDNVAATINNNYSIIIRNDGTDPAKVCLYLTSKFLDGTNSKAYVAVDQANPDATATGVRKDNVDNCATNGPCYTTSGYQYGAAYCNMPTSFANSNCLDLFTSAIGSGAAKEIIASLAKDDIKDEAFIHVGLYIDTNEGTGTKTGTINVVGKSTTASCP